jgi:CheY-like chemotaxis protein
MNFLERHAPIILLIEEDDFDRTTLTRMLKEAGFSVIATNRGASADTFAINHQHIALVLASTGLSDVERIKLDESLYRIDPFVPVIIASRRASHRPNSGEDSGRTAVFNALVAEVQRQLLKKSARSAAQAESFAQAQAPAPAPESEREPEPALSIEATTTDRKDVFFRGLPDAPPLVWGGSSQLKSFPNLDPRNHVARLRKARKARWKRVRRVGMMVAAAGVAPLIVPPLMEMRPQIARAIAQYVPLAAPPLASASVSERMGVVSLVSSTHVSRSRVADDLRAIQSRIGANRQR